MRDIPLSGGLSGNNNPSFRIASHSENLMNSMQVFSQWTTKNKKEHTVPLSEDRGYGTKIQWFFVWDGQLQIL